ncbi:hypothetical protein [Mesoplasma coleopterae]|uniref:MOLPALP family lipoprotein n=1 Tax=Mesoplasma coleopterae TaxID=324078 RepID=A0A2K8P533_9MOLU|nr:hypothetical protein [Mesoplasma coleopterae]ATZ20685.1 hypothetical protein MCOLE_v1c01700 [Mesoplasma coleopterae]
MKKILLSLSALTIGATPAVSLLNVGQKQVITQVTSEIQKKIDETSVLFKAPIITNAQKQNADVTTNWLNDQKVSDISNIDSALSYANFNAEKYDMKSAQKTLNKIYKDKDYKYKNEDAASELIFGAADKGVSLLENSIDDDGLKVEGVNEFLNWISYVSFVSGGSLKADKFDSSILKFADKISFVKMFKHYPAPTYSQLWNEGVRTYRGLKFYALSNFNSFMSVNFGLTSETGGWNFKIQDEGSSNIARNFFNASSAMYKEVFSKDDKKVSKHEFKFTSDSVVYLLNFIYSLSYYIDAFNQPEYMLDPSMVRDQNHLFSPYKTNLEIMNEVYNKNISKENIDKRSLNGILSIFYDIMYKGSDPNGYRSSRVLKILFQVDNDITDGNTNLNFDKKVFKGKPNSWGSLSFDVGEWMNNTTGSNGIFNILFASLATGFINNQISGFIGTFLGWFKLSPENLGSILAGIISSMLSGIDMSYFFNNLSSQLNSTLKNMYSWRLLGIPIGGQIKEPLEKALAGMGFGSENSPNKPHKSDDVTDDFIDYLDKSIKKLSNIKVSENSPDTWSLFDNLFNQLLNEKGRLQSILKLFNVNLPIDMSNKSIKDIFKINVLGISIGDVLTLILKGFDSSLPLFYKILGLLATVTGSDISNEYDFFIKGQEKPLSSINEVLGYTPTDGRTSDLAVIWSMMKFVKDDNGKNKVLGIRPKNSNNTEEEKIWGHKAWKYLLGLNYDDKSYNQDSILFYVNELLTNGLTSKIIQWPVKMTRKYIDYNLSDITFNRNKKMNYWSSKDLFSTQFVSYQEDSKQEVLNYKIMYKVKKDVYYTYNVSVYKENTSSKYKINSFNRI